MYENKPGFGAIFKNKHKTKDTQPDYRGDVKSPDGTDLEIALWIKEGKGGKYFSVKLGEPRAKSEAKAEPETSAGPQLNDEVPFAPQVD